MRIVFVAGFGLFSGARVDPTAATGPDDSLHREGRPTTSISWLPHYTHALFRLQYCSFRATTEVKTLTILFCFPKGTDTVLIDI